MGDGPESPCRIRQLGIESQEIKPGVWGFPGSSAGKESACNGGDLGLIPGLGRSPGGRHGNPLQYSCLENPHEQESGGLLSMGSQSWT